MQDLKLANGENLLDILALVLELGVRTLHPLGFASGW